MQPWLERSPTPYGLFDMLIDRSGSLRALMPYGQGPDDYVHDLRAARGEGFSYAWTVQLPWDPDALVTLRCGHVPLLRGRMGRTGWCRIAMATSGTRGTATGPSPVRPGSRRRSWMRSARA